jgi:hypothetical protein
VEDVRDSPAGKCNERHTATIPSGAPERWRQRTNEYDMALAWADGSGTKRNAIVSEQWAGRALVGQLPDLQGRGTGGCTLRNWK